MAEPIKLMTKPRFKKILLDLEAAADKAAAAGNYELQARILMKLADLSIVVNPELDKRPKAPARNGKTRSKSPTVEEELDTPPLPHEDLTQIPDDELERSLGR